MLRAEAPLLTCSPEFRIATHGGFNMSAGNPDIAERPVVHSPQCFDGFPAREVGDDTVHPTSEQATEAALRAP